MNMEGLEDVINFDFHDFNSIKVASERDPLGENSDVEVVGVDMDSETEDECTEGDTDTDIKRNETISCLENIALSFLSQLTAALKPKASKDSGYSSNSQQEAHHAPKRIVLELASRGKTQNYNDGETKVRSVMFPKKGKAPSARAPAQLLKVASEAHDALVNETPMTKRDLYYRDVSLFKGQTAVDTLVDDLAATFSINRSDLSIRASSKGLFCGSALSIRLHNGSTVVGHDTEPSLIPHAQDIAEFEINQRIAWILVIEKDAVFQTLRGAGLMSNAALPGPGLLITGKGYPDLATRQLVKAFSDNMPENTRILALVDADAYGLDIVSVYKYGSASMRHENASLAAERLEWVGVSAAEALQMGVDRDALLPITVHDQKKALSLLRSSNGLPPAWKRELMQMLHTRRKAEIEILCSVPPNSDRTMENDEDSILDGSDNTISNPLVRYVIWKVNSVLDS